MIIDTTTAPAGPRYFDPATERHQPDGGRAFRCGIRETSYPSGCSSSSGPIAVRTPFGEAVVHQSSFCGATVFAPLDSLDGGGWGSHETWELASSLALPILEKAPRGRATLTARSACPCWRCKAERSPSPSLNNS